MEKNRYMKFTLRIKFPDVNLGPNRTTKNTNKEDTIMKFDTITIKHTNAGEEVWYDYTFQPNVTANEAINLGHFLGWKEDHIQIDPATWTRIFNKRA